MCTVSVISLANGKAPHLAGALGFRVVVNRDEQRDRLAAMQPRWRTLWQGDEDTRAIWPIDPKGGGTWVGATERGLVLCLLNKNLEPEPELPAELVSRGVIIPKVITAGSAAGALAALEDLDPTRFAPFRLVAIEPVGSGRRWSGECRIHEASWDRATLTRREVGEAPACFVSSGLGDSCAADRLPLFAEMVAPAQTAEAQDRFHGHVWPDRPEVSVMMSRADARTVSVTRLEVTPRMSGAAQVRVDYRAVYEAAALTRAAGR